MPPLTHTGLHRRLTNFVQWIRPLPEKEDSIRDQSADIRSRISALAIKDGLIVRGTPNSGSFAKRTGLRRHLQGSHPVDGQDVDLPFVISPKTRNDEEISSLLDRFERYAERSYGQTRRDTTKSSVVLDFVSTKLRYDLVPMLATEDAEHQILLRLDGERRRTSVQRHVRFVRDRTRDSDDITGRVRFNEMVRLFKWWRSVRTGGDDKRVPSIVIDLLCAYAFDQVGVSATYGETLGKWFGLLARTARLRTPIAFGVPATSASGAAWTVRDSVNLDNNVVGGWRGLEVDEFAEWLGEARDAGQRALAADQRGDEAATIDALVVVFGSPFRNHCDGG